MVSVMSESRTVARMYPVRRVFCTVLNTYVRDTVLRRTLMPTRCMGLDGGRMPCNLNDAVTTNCLRTIPSWDQPGLKPLLRSVSLLGISLDLAAYVTELLDALT